MSISVFLKSKLGKVISSPLLGRLINCIPYSIRPGIGKIYSKRRKDIALVNEMSSEEKKEFVFNRLKRLCIYAYSNIEFYRDHYIDNNFDPKILRSFEDLIMIPIVTKSILNRYCLEKRSNASVKSYIVNTGGTSGTPFSFNIQPDSMGHEWAHMHNIWDKFDYQPHAFKLVFGGRSNVKNLVDYDPVRNSFSYDIYASFKEVEPHLILIITKYKIEYLHGYPSSIYQFAIDCVKHNSIIVSLLTKSLKGVFLGSEFPHDVYRDTIEKTFNTKSISWYGHTERAVLAGERKERLRYYPFLSYGHTEAIFNGADGYNLVSTSYYNYASPLIRYDTEDLVDNIKIVDGLVDSFEVRKGRSGETVVDSNGNDINLTGLIFGRHHKIFDYIDFIQVKQLANGKVLVYYVSKDLDNVNTPELFDASNVSIQFSFKSIKEPFRTEAGKINLLIKD